MGQHIMGEIGAIGRFGFDGRTGGVRETETGDTREDN